MSRDASINAPGRFALMRTTNGPLNNAPHDRAFQWPALLWYGRGMARPRRADGEAGHVGTEPGAAVAPPSGDGAGAGLGAGEAIRAARIRDARGAVARGDLRAAVELVIAAMDLARTSEPL